MHNLVKHCLTSLACLVCCPPGGGPLEVLQDLPLPAVVPGPGGVGVEAVAVEVAGHVARAPRVRVVMPRAAQAGGLLQYRVPDRVSSGDRKTFDVMTKGLQTGV